MTALSPTQRRELGRRPDDRTVNWPGVAEEIARLRVACPAAFVYVLHLSESPGAHHRIRCLIRDHGETWRAWLEELQAALPAFPARYFDTAPGANHAGQRLDEVRRSLCGRELPALPDVPEAAGAAGDASR